MFSFMSSYSCLNDIVSTLDLTLSSTKVSDYCNQVLRAYFCNYAYPGCDPSNKSPIGICHKNCMKYLFGGKCEKEITTLVNFALSFEGIHFVRQCNNTLMFLNDSGFVTNENSASDVNITLNRDVCNNISGIYSLKCHSYNGKGSQSVESPNRGHRWNRLFCRRGCQKCAIIWGLE